MKYIDALIKYAKKNLDCSNELAESKKEYLYELFQDLETSIDVDKLDLPDELVNQGYEYLLKLKYTPKAAEDEMTRVFGVLTPNPKDFREKFFALYSKDKITATDWYYKNSVMNDYVKWSKINQNICWVAEFDKCEVEVTINLSKPEKKNSDIKAAVSKPQVIDVPDGYPKCVICIENECCHGGYGTPARDNLRLIPLKLNNNDWYLQYSPYGYYDEHCICIYKDHIPMKVCKENMGALLDFTEQFPHYFMGSNSDLPIVGGSILSHEHFQGGKHLMPMLRSSIKEELRVDNYPGIKVGILNWPSKAFIVRGNNKSQVLDVSYHIVDKWHDYSDPSIKIYSFSDNEQHNSCSTIAHKVGDEYRMYIIPRNNRCTAELPEGIFHVDPSRMHIKSEGIGLIEASGRFILPARLKRQLKAIDEIISQPELEESILKENGDMDNFKDMINEIRQGKYKDSTDYVNWTCYKILEDISAFKYDSNDVAFSKFVKVLDL